MKFRTLSLVAFVALTLTACGTMPRVEVDTPEQGIAALRECKTIEGASCRVANGGFEGQVGEGAPLGDPNNVARSRSFLGTPPPWYGTPVDPRFGYGYGGYYPSYGYPYGRGSVAIWGRF